MCQPSKKEKEKIICNQRRIWTSRRIGAVIDWPSQRFFTRKIGKLINTLQLRARLGNESSTFRFSGVRAPGGAIERAKMRGADTYEQYATECERIARTMSGEQRKSLMAIAEAWRELAREAERRPSSSREK